MLHADLPPSSDYRRGPPRGAAADARLRPTDPGLRRSPHRQWREGGVSRSPNADMIQWEMGDAATFSNVQHMQMQMHGFLSAVFFRRQCLIEKGGGLTGDRLQ